jgi:stage II sporulation protein D
MKPRFTFILFLALLYHPALSGGETMPGLEGLFDMEVRVLLDGGALNAEIDGGGGKLLVTSGETGAKLNLPEGDRVFAEGDLNGMKINHLSFPVHSVRIETSGKYIVFNGKKYRGYILLWDGHIGTFEAVNHLPLETYIKSVVAAEIPKSWPLEAQKAQAVAARTYALYKRQENAGNHFDVAMDVSDQAYGGAEAESDIAEQAVKGTAGMVLVFNNKLALAYFHSNSWDKTENAVDVFHGTDVPYLRSVTCRFARKSPYYTWQLNMSLAEIESALARGGVFSGKIRDISPSSFTPTGRVKQLRIAGGQKTELVEATAFRRALGGTKFKSTKFTIRKFGQTYSFIGNGYGHGVGLCQWGAKGMAENKSSFKEILAHYYPGALVSDNILVSNVE